MTAPVDNLVRAWAGPEATALRVDGPLRADGPAGSTMVGHFAVFNRWTEIDSWFEGRFLERIAPGAFTDTFAAREGQIRVLYDHGADPQIGNKPLGTPQVLREDRTGAYYEVDLFDASYVNDLKPAIRAGQLGASFRFRVTGEDWTDPTEATDHNPDMLPERTITGTELYEFGPVTFPAYPDASAGMRSRTDEFLDHFLNDPAFVARFKERVGPAVVNQIVQSLPIATTYATTSYGQATFVDVTADGGTSDPAGPPTADRETPEVTADGGDRDQQRRADYYARRTAAYEAHQSRR